jgi:hypothetical protein
MWEQLEKTPQFVELTNNAPEYVPGLIFHLIVKETAPNSAESLHLCEDGSSKCANERKQKGKKREEGTGEKKTSVI